MDLLLKSLFYYGLLHICYCQQNDHEPPPDFSHSSGSYWSNPSAYELGAKVCQETTNDLIHAQDHLFRVKDNILDQISCGGNTNCTKIIISSVSRALLRHAPRFGLYVLETVYNSDGEDAYPAYFRKASNQNFFFKEEYEKWQYAHKFERWLIGPKIGDENGGIVFMTDTRCPWDINFDATDVYFYDKLMSNPWNPIGNGWRMDTGYYVECYDADTYPPFSCGCNVLNVTSDGGRISESHPQKLGLYHLISQHRTIKNGFLAPVYKKEGNPNQYLYSHHHEGRLWLLGQSYTSWSVRLDAVTPFRDEIVVESLSIYHEPTKHIKIGAICPNHIPPNGIRWEYLQSRNGEDEIWLKDSNFKIDCVG